MPFNRITVKLTEEQLTAIRAATGNPLLNKFALLAQPWLEPHREAGNMFVYILTPEQYASVNSGIHTARTEAAYKPLAEEN